MEQLKAIRTLLRLGNERDLFVCLQYAFVLFSQPKYVSEAGQGVTREGITRIPIEQTQREYRAEGTSTKPLELSASGVG